MTSMYRNTRDQKTSRWNYQIGCLFMPSRTTYSGVFRSDAGQRKTTVRLRDTMWFGLNYLFAKVRGALFAKVTVIVLKKLVFSFIFTWKKSYVAKHFTNAGTVLWKSSKTNILLINPFTWPAPSMQTKSLYSKVTGPLLPSEFVRWLEGACWKYKIYLKVMMESLYLQWEIMLNSNWSV